MFSPSCSPLLVCKSIWPSLTKFMNPCETFICQTFVNITWSLFSLYCSRPLVCKRESYEEATGAQKSPVNKKIVKLLLLPFFITLKIGLFTSEGMVSEWSKISLCVSAAPVKSKPGWITKFQKSFYISLVWFDFQPLRCLINCIFGLFFYSVKFTPSPSSSTDVVTRGRPLDLSVSRSSMRIWRDRKCIFVGVTEGTDEIITRKQTRIISHSDRSHEPQHTVLALIQCFGSNAWKHNNATGLVMNSLLQFSNKEVCVIHCNTVILCVSLRLRK